MKYQIQGLRKSHSVLFGIKSDCNVLRLVCFVQQKKKKRSFLHLVASGVIALQS